jgi:nucleotide-binding universal stress UspA family protein
MSGYVAAVPELQAEAQEIDLERLEGLLTTDDRKSLNARTVLHYLDATAHALAEYAKHESVDLIVIGTHGRRGLSHLVMGSVAEKVVRTAPCPVLVIRDAAPDSIAPSIEPAVAAEN